MNWRTASSVCGAVGLFAILLEDARDAAAAKGEDEPDAPSVVADEKKLDEDEELEGAVGVAVGAPGGWWRSRKRTPVPVRNAEMYADAGG